MAMFPHLNTGAVAQYSASVWNRRPARVIYFIDGQDQRYTTSYKALRTWQIRLELLNEDEIDALQAFFLGQMGAYSTFSFYDPFSGQIVPNCRFATESFSASWDGVDVGSTALLVTETNG
jgi:hypothetical protein